MSFLGPLTPALDFWFTSGLGLKVRVNPNIHFSIEVPQNLGVSSLANEVSHGDNVRAPPDQDYTMGCWPLPEIITNSGWRYGLEFDCNQEAIPLRGTRPSTDFNS